MIYQLTEPKSKLRENKENEVSPADIEKTNSGESPSSNNTTTTTTSTTPSQSSVVAASTPPSGVGTLNTPTPAEDGTATAVQPTSTDSITQGEGVNGDGQQASTTLLPATADLSKGTGSLLESSVVTSVDAASSSIQSVSADQTATSDSGLVAPSDTDTSRVDDSFIFQQVQAGDSGPGLPLSSTAAPAAIPGLDSLFQEGVDYRKQQQPSQNSSAVNNTTADDEDSADSDAYVDSAKPTTSPTSASDQKKKGHSETFDPRRPLSLPLPPTTGEDEMEEEEESEEAKSAGRAEPTEPVVEATDQSSSPVLPLVSTESAASVNPSITDMVSSAVK